MNRRILLRTQYTSKWHAALVYGSSHLKTVLLMIFSFPFFSLFFYFFFSFSVSGTVSSFKSSPEYFLRVQIQGNFLLLFQRPKTKYFQHTRQLTTQQPENFYYTSHIRICQLRCLTIYISYDKSNNFLRKQLLMMTYTYAQLDVPFFFITCVTVIAKLTQT